MVALVYGLSRVREAAELANPATLGFLLAGVVLISAFCVHSRRTPSPLVDVGLFRSRAFTASSLLVFLHAVAVYGPLFVLPLFYARALGHDSATIGWLLAPQGLGMLLGISVAGWLLDRYEPRMLVFLSTVLAAAGTVAFTRLAADPGDVLLGASLCLRGIGLGVVGIAIVTTAYRDVPADRIPRGTVMIAVVQRAGASFGTAVVALLLSMNLGAADGTGAAAAQPAPYADTFWWVLVLGAAMVVPLLWMPRRPAETPGGDASDEVTGPVPHRR
jgi:predicted MFS family arabinose efflux permease